jgi:hypothetical protein
MAMRLVCFNYRGGRGAGATDQGPIPRYCACNLPILQTFDRRKYVGNLVAVPGIT